MEIIDPLQDRKSQVCLIDHMGGDLSIVNDARTSFDTTHRELTEGDIRLINFLIHHSHTSPLRGSNFKFRIKAPLFVCRQWWKHVIASNHNDEQLGWNEKSFRYVSIEDPDEFYIPEVFRRQAKDNKQATEGALPEADNRLATSLYANQCRESYRTYKQLLNLGVGREQARGVLAPSYYTTWVWTCSLQALLHFIDLRKGAGAQSEIGAYAHALKELASHYFPHTIEAWDRHGSI